MTVSAKRTHFLTLLIFSFALVAAALVYTKNVYAQETPLEAQDLLSLPSLEEAPDEEQDMPDAPENPDVSGISEDAAQQGVIAADQAQDQTQEQTQDQAQDQTQEQTQEEKKDYVAVDAAASDAPPPNTEEGVESIEDVRPEQIPSLIFTYWEHTALYDARNSIGTVRPTTEAELKEELNKKQEPKGPKPPPEEREIRLGGIAYSGKDDWTIWLNEQRVTPNAVPKEVIELRVFNNYIEIKWYDDYTNKIFPIRLRPHQRFNIDTRIFLPG